MVCVLTVWMFDPPCEREMILGAGRHVSNKSSADQQGIPILESIIINENRPHEARDSICSVGLRGPRRL
jgi:hypothetical protein